MSEKKPLPIETPTARKECPVCGKPAYSKGGIHPQCATLLSDTPRRTQLAAEKKAKAIEKTQNQGDLD